MGGHCWASPSQWLSGALGEDPRLLLGQGKNTVTDQPCLLWAHHRCELSLPPLWPGKRQRARGQGHNDVRTGVTPALRGAQGVTWASPSFRPVIGKLRLIMPPVLVVMRLKGIRVCPNVSFGGVCEGPQQLGSAGTMAVGGRGRLSGWCSWRWWPGDGSCTHICLSSSLPAKHCQGWTRVASGSRRSGQLQRTFWPRHATAPPSLSSSVKWAHILMN